jgi:PAS domain-containing protein
VLAGTSVPAAATGRPLLPWSTPVNEYEVPVSPVGNGLILRAQAYRTSLGVIGSGCSGWWRAERHDRLDADRQLAPHAPAVQAQQALVSETNFRRAMENSMLTGMRAMDLQGRITYVNAAFCQMTGWSEAELVGRTAPFPYWPDRPRDAGRAAGRRTGGNSPRRLPGAGQAQGRQPV